MADDAGSVDAGNPADAGTGNDAAAAPSPGEVNAVPGSALNTNPAPSWLDGINDPATKDWARAKGLQNGSFENVLGSYHNLERMVGADKAGRTVTMLGDEASAEDTAAFYNKLGRPEKAAGYSVELPVSAGGDSSRMDLMRNKAHELGITDKQFKGLVEADDAYISALTTDTAANEASNTALAVATLQKEWGAAYDQKGAGIDAAAGKLGMTSAQLNGLRVSMGSVDAMKFVDGLNTKIGDHDFDTGIPTGGGITPADAQIQLNELNLSKEFMEAWLNRQHPGHKAAVEKKARLARLVTGEV